MFYGHALKYSAVVQVAVVVAVAMAGSVEGGGNLHHTATTSYQQQQQQQGPAQSVVAQSTNSGECAYSDTSGNHIRVRGVTYCQIC